ncbi:hypothetical protein CRG98_021116 [Punica granatum]|uniref:Uncharacterized protein n=1 Tax=Punica granatum TaxID=22663 RepID=A0A2I0JRG5_PUNGR|nr:hypothetical protein CRG98_021116 [Punica granatum]
MLHWAALLGRPRMLLWAKLLGRPRRKRPAGEGVDRTGPTEIRPMIDRANARVNTCVGLTQTDITRRPVLPFFSTRSLIRDFPPISTIRRTPRSTRAASFPVSFSSLDFALVAAALVVPTINVAPLLIKEILLCGSLGEESSSERCPSFVRGLSRKKGYTNFLRDYQHDTGIVGKDEGRVVEFEEEEGRTVRVEGEELSAITAEKEIGELEG